ncbi:B2 protein [Linum perenne]
MPFDREHNRITGRFPEYGAIFMSNDATKKECFERQLFGLPTGQADFVMHVKAGMILFLFEYGKRELHGVFQACSDGAMNIVPHAYSGSGIKFPAQVRFTTIWRCSPLPESLFSGAIRENYFAANKFNFGLNERQVENLLHLFNPRKLERQPHCRQFPQSNINRSTLDDVKEHEEVIDYGRHDLHKGRYAQNLVAVSGPVPSSQNSEGLISFNKRVTGEYTSTTIGNEHRLNDRSVPLTRNDYVGDFISKVEGAVHDAYHLSKENGISADFAPSLCDRSHVSESILATNTRGPSTGYDSPVSSDKPVACHSYLPLYGSRNHIYETNSLVKDDLQSKRHSLEPGYSSFSYSVSDVESMPKPMLSRPYSVSTRETEFDNPQPYNPDAPGLDINRSSLVGVSSSLPESLPRLNSAYTSYENQFPLPFRGLGDHISLRYDHSNSSGDTPSNNGGDSYRPNMPYYQNARAEHDVSTEILFPRPSLPPLPVTENHRSHAPEKLSWPPVNTPVSGFRSQVPTYSIPNVEGTHTGRANHGANSPAGWGGGQDSERINPNDKNREGSVFNRLVFPPQESKQGAIDFVEYDDDDKDLSVNEIMTSLRSRWVKENPVKALNVNHNAPRSSWKRKQWPSKSRLSNNCSSEVPVETNEDATAAAADVTTEDDVPLKYEDPPFVNFKRRSSLRKVQNDAKSHDSSVSANNGTQSTEQRKRKKLIRPDFSDVLFGKLEKECSSSQIGELSAVEPCTTQEGNDVAAKQNTSLQEKVEHSSPSSIGSPDNGGIKSMHKVEILDATLSGATC